TDPVGGTFAGLPEGAAVSVGVRNFTVSYHGGDGNDVTLTAARAAEPITVGAGAGGGPHVKVHNADGSLRSSFFAYDAVFTVGVSVAAGDVNGDGFADVVTGAGAGGGPHVEVFSGKDNSVLAS